MVCHINLALELFNLAMLLWLARKLRAQSRRIAVLKVLSGRPDRR